jgi:serine/threonine protein kinase
MKYQELSDPQKYLTHPFDKYHGRQIATQVLEGLRFMHENGFVYWDFKSGNTMVVARSPERFVKIADFGTSKRRQEGVTSLRTMQQGTFGYTTPEVLGFSPSQNAASYTSSVDMWPLGVMVYILLTNVIPFPSIVDLYQDISAASPLPTEPLDTNQVSETARGFIAELLAPNPEKRLAASSALNHAWMSLGLNSSCPGDTKVAIGLVSLEILVDVGSLLVPGLVLTPPSNTTWVSEAPSKAWSDENTMRVRRNNEPKASPLAASVEDYPEEDTDHCGLLPPPNSVYVLDLATEPVVYNTATPWPAKTS